jgi:hypothetical protein
MKTLLPASVLLLVANLSWAGGMPATATTKMMSVQGEVQEAKDAAGYTYLRLQTSAGEAWAAVPKASVKKGDQVTVQHPMVMNDFTSQTLHKTFKTIYFGTLAGTATATPGGYTMGEAHAGLSKPVDTSTIHVAKASGPDARTVAEVNAQVAELKDKPVLVRGKVVKYNPGIMGRNWIHLRDGTGSPADRSNDLLVTSVDRTKVGDVITAKGTVRADKDFGFGYSYKVLVEDATLGH